MLSERAAGTKKVWKLHWFSILGLNGSFEEIEIASFVDLRNIQISTDSGDDLSNSSTRLRY